MYKHEQLLWRNKLIFKTTFTLVLIHHYLYIHYLYYVYKDLGSELSMYKEDGYDQIEISVYMYFISCVCIILIILLFYFHIMYPEYYLSKYKD